MQLGTGIFTLGVILLSAGCLFASSDSVCVSRTENSSSDIIEYRDKLEYHIKLWHSFFSGDNYDITGWFVLSGNTLKNIIISKIDAVINKPPVRLNNQDKKTLADLTIIKSFITTLSAEEICMRSNIRLIKDRIYCLQHRDPRLFGLSTLFNACLWLLKDGKNILKDRTNLISETKSLFIKFPIDAICQKIRSPHLRDALKTLYSTGNCDSFYILWQHIDFDKNNPESLLLIKEFSSVIYALYVFFMLDLLNETYEKGLSDYLPSENSKIMNVLHLYSLISDLPIDQTIIAIDRFISAFYRVLTQFEQNNNENKEGEDTPSEEGQDNNFIGWLQSKQVFISLAVVVIAIKAIYYFWVQKYKQTSPAIFVGNVISTEGLFSFTDKSVHYFTLDNYCGDGGIFPVKEAYVQT